MPTKIQKKLILELTERVELYVFLIKIAVSSVDGCVAVLNKVHTKRNNFGSEDEGDYD